MIVRPMGKIRAPSIFGMPALWLASVVFAMKKSYNQEVLKQKEGLPGAFSIYHGTALMTT